MASAMMNEIWKFTGKSKKIFKIMFCYMKSEV